MKTFSKIITGMTVTLVILLSFSVVYAEDEYVELAPLPGTASCAGSGTGQTCVTNLPSYIAGILNLSIGIAAVLAMAMITFGGIMYATSDAISGKSQGREYVENAVWGLILVIGAYVILNTINPNILKFSLAY